MYNINGVEFTPDSAATLFGSFIGLGIGIIFFLFLITLPILILYIIGLWKIFKKAGKPGWYALIPFYNTYVLIEISGLNWWYFLIAISGTICSVLNTVCFLLSMASRFFIFYNLAKKFKKDPVPWGIGGALVSIIITLIFGFSSSFVYESSVEVSKNGPINK